MRSAHIWLATILVSILFVVTKPAGPWEFDEILFFQGVHHYEPLAHHPPPPGYPLFIAAGKLFRALIPNDHAAMTTLNIAASTIAFALLALAFGRIASDPATGLTAALLFYLSPSMLVNAAEPMSDAGGVAWIAAAIWASGEARVASGRSDELPFPLATRYSPLAAIALAIAVGWRQQLAIFAVPFLFAMLARRMRWRDRALALAAFTIVCLIWLAALAHAVGGFDALLRFETAQAGYVAAHDAAESRSGWTAASLTLRFLAHPWGMKLLAFPLLAVAALGIAIAVRRRLTGAIPLAVAGAIYFAFALRTMDPADGVRYAIPSLLATAFFAALGIRSVARVTRIPAPLFAIVYGIGALAYTGPMLWQRARSDSPPAQAAAYARAAYPRGAGALYELPLWPHAQYLLADFAPMRVNDGLAALYDRPDVPLFLYADGASSLPGARVFRWKASDAYSKLTRNHYRVVSIVPIPPERRFRPLAGVFSTERDIDGDEWRWLAPVATLELPHAPASSVAITFSLPKNSILATNDVTLASGAQTVRATVRRGERTVVTLPLSGRGGDVITVRCAQSVVPSEVAGSNNHDTRRLGVTMVDLVTRR